MALGLCRVTAQKVLASVIVPHLKVLQGEERFFMGGGEGEIALCGSFFKSRSSLHLSV